MDEEKSEFGYTKKSAWECFSDEQIQEAYSFCEGYKDFLGKVKTEREAIDVISKITEHHNRKTYVNKHASAAIITKGLKPLSEGLRIIISHVDSPRLDLKQIPLFEDSESNLAMFQTHYYGGIKKFQWVTIPLSIHGVVIKKDGSKVTFSLGEDINDPVFFVPDLLPHLSHKIQDNKKLKDAIQGEYLDLAIGTKLDKNSEKNKLKNAILNKLHEEYGLIEEDFISAELEIVPSFKPRDVGFDRSMIGAYGQDDRVCAYTSLKAVLDVENPNYTSIVLFVDKEEIGSEGNTSAQSATFLRSLITEIDPNVDIDKVMLNSKVISADVDAAITPNYTEVFELKNASAIGKGISMSKYTGHGGKYSANDASAEYVGEIRRMLNDHQIPWQTGELGKVDNGGGGTVAKYFSRLGMSVIDVGPPVLCMHAPFEITSKLDVYACYLTYKAFLTQ
ncbi:aminopeptidase [Thermoplasmatales archaeon ex4572_165]|nr:MAG: aminopeptidase [Thermoplasmatales archaeon ex4572_165]RLF58975.1 MAG: aminopeptidase [Thermoplasmata archaeon]